MGVGFGKGVLQVRCVFELKEGVLSEDRFVLEHTCEIALLVVLFPPFPYPCVFSFVDKQVNQRQVHLFSFSLAFTFSLAFAFSLAFLAVEECMVLVFA